MKWLKDFGAIVAVALAALGGAVTYGALQSGQKQNSDDIAVMKFQVQQNTTDTAVMKQSFNDMKESLKRIEDAVGTKR